MEIPAFGPVYHIVILFKNVTEVENKECLQPEDDMYKEQTLDLYVLSIKSS